MLDQRLPAAERLPQREQAGPAADLDRPLRPGGVESLIEPPARMTPASVTGSPLEVPADQVRLSVGIEDADDLLDDLSQALS